MSTILSDFSKAPAALPNFLLNNLEWSEQQSNYARWRAHYAGESLRVHVEDKSPFPLRINPFRYLSHIHASLTLGVPGNYEAPIRFWAEPLDISFDETEKTEDIVPGRIVMKIWKENGINNILNQIAVWFQVYGGVFLRVLFAPRFVNSVRLDVIRPDFVFPVFGMDGFEEVYIVTPVSRQEALRYGYNTDVDGTGVYTKVEHWTRESWEIRIGTILETQLAIQGGKELRGENPFRLYGEPIIPIIYAARYPVDQYGVSLFEDIIGLVEEINLRAASMGAVVGERNFPIPVAFNWYGPRSPDGRILFNIEPNEFVDGGMAAPNAPQQELKIIEPANIPESHVDFIKNVERFMLHATMTSPVVLGEDTGSQRSAETLAVRALPTAAAITQYRQALAEAFNLTNRLIYFAYRMQVRRSLPPSENYRFNTTYLPIFPKDQAAQVQALSLLRQVGLTSRQTGIRELGLVTDLNSEIKRLQEEAMEEAVLEAIPHILQSTIVPPQTSLASQTRSESVNGNKP